MAFLGIARVRTALFTDRFVSFPSAYELPVARRCLGPDRFLVNHTHSPLARAMYVAMRSARVNDKFQDSLYLFLELVRAGVMHGHLWSGRAFSGGPSFGTGEARFSHRSS